MSQDRVTSLYIEGFRTIDRLVLNLSPLTVLIGDNGSGKSTIIEALELLRRSISPNFFDDFNQIHGGFRGLRRTGASTMSLGLRVEKEGEPWVSYGFTLTDVTNYPVVTREDLAFGAAEAGTDAVRLIQRTLQHARVFDAATEQSQLRELPRPTEGLILGSISPLFSPHPAFIRMREVLAGLDVHLPFDALPSWAARAEQRPSALRSSNSLQPTSRLERLGKNLSNAYFALRNESPPALWQQAMSYIRLGLGDRVEDVTTRADASGGMLALAMKLRGHDSYLNASQLSNGTLVYLAFVALALLPSSRSLLAMDEPELHLHPALLGRVMQMFKDVADGGCPVLLATHSDRVLDALDDPANQVRICELDEGSNRLNLRSLEPAALDVWMKDFRGLGELRNAGFLGMTMKSESDDAEKPGFRS